MYTREELSQLIEEYIHALPLEREPKELYEPIIYTLDEGGKRLRPLLLLITADLYGAAPADALPAAAAIEIFHNFTLLHDDVMDNGIVRRGKSTVFKKWGLETAMLSGDAMVIFAYHMLEKYPPELLGSILPEFNRMALEVCEGQQFDMNFESREDVTQEEYKEMIRLKTAVIFAVAAKIGGLIGGASKSDCEKLYELGYEIGMAFQIQDDYLDTYGSPELLGKAVGGDIAESKKTFLVINALNEAGDATRRALLATFTDTSHPLPHKINRVKTIYDSLDIPELTRGIISGHLDKALSALFSLEAEQGRLTPMKELIKSLADRSK